MVTMVVLLQNCLMVIVERVKTIKIVIVIVNEIHSLSSVPFQCNPVGISYRVPAYA